MKYFSKMYEQLTLTLNISQNMSQLPAQITQHEIEATVQKREILNLGTTMATLCMVSVCGIPLMFFNITGSRIIRWTRIGIKMFLAIILVRIFLFKAKNLYFFDQIILDHIFQLCVWFLRSHHI